MSPTIVPSESFTLLPTTLADTKAVWQCGDRAFGPASFRAYIFPPSKAHLTSPEELAAWRQRHLAKMIKGSDTLHFKCVPQDDPGKVVGYAAWYRPGHFAKGRTLAESWETKKTRPESDLSAQAGPDGGKPSDVVYGNAGNGKEMEDEGEKEEFPACMDVEKQRECTAIMDEERKKLWGEDANYWYLGGLAVDPEYQGRGLARKLVEQGLAWADADGVPTYLEATPEGAKIYPKFGFEKVGEYGFFGGEHVCGFHVRQPGASKLTTVEAEKR